MNDLTTRQGATVKLKYEVLYGAMAQATKAVVADPKLDPAAKFARLKELLSGVWAGVIAAMASGQKNLEWPDILARSEAYKVNPSTWLDGTTPVAGTQKQRDDAVDKMFLNRVHHYLPKDCELVLDLGCGWGHRLFDVWRTGGPQSALYVGGDRSPHTGQIISDVSTLFPGMRVGWFPFDYLNPDFGGLPDHFQSIAVYSFHAIEQVTLLGPALLQQLTARYPKARIRGIHLEPIGFQLDHTDHLAAEAAEAVRAWAIRRNYNLDLVEQIKANPKLKLSATENAIFTRDEANITSVVVWDTV